MKYDALVAEVKNLLPSARNILIALPVGSDIDKLAGGLALYLSLKSFVSAQDKQVSIVCDDTIKVSQSHLFGIDQVKNTIPQSGGNYMITLEGVAVDGKVPSLEKLDYSVQSNNLNLFFNVLPGQTFNPTKVTPGFQGGKFDIIFTLGAANLTSLGSLGQNLSGSHLVNIDKEANANFGQTNVVDPLASSISEMITDIISSLGLNFDADTASNLLAGIFSATSQLTNEKVNADTYLAVSTCLKAGGKKPIIEEKVHDQSGFDFSALLPTTPVQPSPEERPVGEQVVTDTGEPDWLTPKVFKGSSIG